MLKEFDLDAPTLLKNARQSFRHQSRCVTALYERLFKPFPINEKAWKVLIEVIPVVAKPHVRDLLGVLTLQVAGEPELFLLADRDRKSRLALDWLTKGAVKLAKLHNWPVRPFEDAANAVSAAGCINIWTWKHSFWNKSKTISCHIKVEHGFDEAKIVAVFADAKGHPISSTLLCSTAPSEFAFVPFLGSAKWLDERRVELKSKNGNHTREAVVADPPASTLPG